MYQLPRALRLRQQHSLLQHTLRQQQRNFTSIPRRRYPQTLWKPSGEPVRYQAVRFKKPPYFTWRRALTIGVYTGFTYAYFSLILRYLDVEVEILDDEEALTEEEKKWQRENPGKQLPSSEPEVEEGPFYAEEDSTFIPLTWAKKLPRTFYKGSDPEWQAFVKVAKDKPRHKKIQEELVSIVFAGCAQHPTISRQLGKEPKVGKYWLDISFPDGPPQEYERSGIEIGNGFIAWSQQKVSQESQWRLTRALWPSAAFHSFWATGRVLVGIQYRRVKQALGWEGRDPFSPEERYRHAIEMMEKQQQSRERKGVGETQTSPDGNPTSAIVTTSNSADAAAKPSIASPTVGSNASSQPDSKKLPWHIPVPMPSASAASSADIPIAMHTFSHTLSKLWSPKKTEPPRGTFVVQGLVEVRGQRGRMLFDVSSAYDPGKGKHVKVEAAVRGFKRWNQAPRGGP